MKNEEKKELQHVINNALCGPHGIIAIILAQDWPQLDEITPNGKRTYRESLLSANTDIALISDFLYNITPKNNE